MCSGVDLWETAAPAVALAHPDPHPSAVPIAPKGPPAVLVRDVQRCAGVDERTDIRQMAVAHRPVQRRPAMPVHAKARAGVGVAQRVTRPAYWYPSHTACSGKWRRRRGRAPVLDVKVLLALKQQFLHATQLLDHGNRRDRVCSGFGEAWAVARALQGDSRLTNKLSEPSARMHYAPQTI
jgi:hypothetical protein